jgi:hypothetical protein
MAPHPLEAQNSGKHTGLAAAKMAPPVSPLSFCPNCSAQLQEFRCKLTCPQCGFYLSCSDFY